MSTLVNSPTLGLEMIGREALIVLIETLNDELLHQDEIWAPLDEELADKREVTYEEILTEPVELQNFYPGHQPSLIKAPVDKYPNVSVMADRAGPAPVNDYDQISIYNNQLFIEFMVKSGKSEEEVNSRAQRTADAINICMMSNRTLRGAVAEIGDVPTAELSDVFIRKERVEGYGDRWFWQGGRIEYTVTKEASMPQGSSARPAALAADIDQS